MYDKLVLKECGNIHAFIEHIVQRICCSRELRDKLNAELLANLRRVGPADLLVNQVVYEEGVRRWCSDTLSSLIPFITSSSGAHCQALGASHYGLGQRDIRAMHARVLFRVMNASDVQVQVNRKATVWPEAREAMMQWLDYLRHKSKSREVVNKLLDGVQPSYPIPPQRSPDEVIAEAIAKQFSAFEPIKDNMESNMSLGVNVSPFNFNRPAIEDIKFVYGISVKDLTLDHLTTVLTQRQAEADRLKALPHKPEVVKEKIRAIKKDIADILALANQLFPVAE